MLRHVFSSVLHKARPPSPLPFDTLAVRGDFPILTARVNGKPLVYLDNASTTQKPHAVIDAEATYYRTMNANIHRGIHRLAEQATAAYEQARKDVARFIGATQSKEIIFTRSATESLNIIAQAWGRANLEAGDEVLLTEMEHHSNIVPWQIVAREKGAKVLYWPITDEGFLDPLGFSLIGKRTKMVALTHVSNVLGTVNPIADIVARAHNAGALVLLDAAQSVAHIPVNVSSLGIDFAAFSAHKMYGPTGVGVLWGRKELLEILPPFMLGSDMVKQVRKEGAIWNDVPWKFEAGTMNIAGVITFAHALRYIQQLGRDAVEAHERELLTYALGELMRVEALHIFGPKDASLRRAVISFSLGDVHPHDLATVLDEEGVAIRSGHHCAQVLMDRLNVVATARASFALYNTHEDVDRLVSALQAARKTFRIDKVSALQHAPRPAG